MRDSKLYYIMLVLGTLCLAGIAYAVKLDLKQSFKTSASQRSGQSQKGGESTAAGQTPAGPITKPPTVFEFPDRAIQTQIDNVKIVHDFYTQFTPGPFDSLSFSWKIMIGNDTPDKVVSAVWLRMISKSPSGDVATPPQRLITASNMFFPITGALLPGKTTDAVAPMTFVVRNDDWRVDTQLQLEITKVEYAQSDPLTSIPALYAKLIQADPKDATALFEKNPSLLKIHNGQGLNATLLAFATCAPETIEYVVAHGGGDVKSRCGPQSFGIMEMATQNARPGALDEALKNGAGANDNEANHGYSALLVAIEAKSLPAEQWLVSHGANVNDVEPYNFSPLAMAIEEGFPDQVDFLIAHGANVHYKSPGGYSLLYYAVNNSPGLISTMIKAGIPVDERDDQGGTALMWALRHTRNDADVELLQYGANPYLKDKQGHDCFYYARESNTLHSDQFLRTNIAYAKKHPKK